MQLFAKMTVFHIFLCLFWSVIWKSDFKFYFLWFYRRDISLCGNFLRIFIMKSIEWLLEHQNIFILEPMRAFWISLAKMKNGDRRMEMKWNEKMEMEKVFQMFRCQTHKNLGTDLNQIPFWSILCTTENKLLLIF